MASLVVEDSRGKDVLAHNKRRPRGVWLWGLAGCVDPVGLGSCAVYRYRRNALEPVTCTWDE